MDWADDKYVPVRSSVEMLKDFFLFRKCINRFNAVQGTTFVFQQPLLNRKSFYFILFYFYPKTWIFVKSPKEDY